MLEDDSLTKERVEGEISRMAEMGVRDLVLHSAALEDDAHYSTDLPWLKRHGKEDGLELILSAADRRGISIYLYGYDSAGYWENQNAEYYDTFAKKGIEVADEVYRKYGHHKSLAGFHLCPEFFYPANDELVSAWVDHYIKPFVAHVRKLNPKLLITTAPFVGRQFPCTTEHPGYDSTKAKEFWDKLLKDRCIDVVILQDGIGADENIPGGSESRSCEFIHTMFGDISEVCKKYDVQLWDDLEAFAAVGVCYPPHYSRTIRQLAAARPYAARFVAFEWLYLCPSTGVSAVEYQQNWKRFNKGDRLIQMVSRGREYKFSTPPAFPRSEDAYLLTDGGMESSPTQFVAWNNGKPVDVVVDLGTVWNDITGFAGSFRCDSKVTLPIKSADISVSSDGKHFRQICTMDRPTTLDGEVRVYRNLLDHKVSGRYVKYTVFPGAQKTLQIGELAAFAEADRWISKGCEYTIDAQPDYRVCDEGLKLTDWDDAPQLYAQVGWHNATSPMHVTLDLGRARKVERLEASFFKSSGDEPSRKHILGGLTANLPHGVLFQYSEDGKTYTRAVAAQAHGFGRSASYTYGLNMMGSKARYIRLTIDPTKDGWTMISELRAIGD